MHPERARKQAMTSKPTYRLAEGTLSVPVEEEAIILSISAGKYFGVRGAMRHLLEELRDGLSFDDMVERTCARYGIERARAREDLQEILPRLIDAGIVETAAPASAPAPASPAA
jgi:hypothetical protein